MKKEIHPKYYPNAKVVCACGNSFTVGATVPKMEIEICSFCHPLFTGKAKYVDTAGRLERFKKRLEKTEKLKKKSSNVKAQMSNQAQSSKSK